MRNWIGAVLALAAAACSAHYPGSPTPSTTIAGVQLHYTRPHTFVSIGSSVSFTLYSIDTDGVMENVTGRATWFASDSGIATVTPGTARAIANGATDVVASFQGFTATARVLVQSSRFFPYLEIGPAPTHQTGASSQAGAVLVNGSLRQSVADQAAWASSDPRVITVERGMVTSHGPGTAAITASFNGLSATYYTSVPPIRVLP